MNEAEDKEVARGLNNVNTSLPETTTGAPGGAAASSFDVEAPKADEVRFAEARDQQKVLR